MTPRAEKEPITRPSDRARGRVLLIADDRETQFVDEVSARGIDVFGVSNGTAAMAAQAVLRDIRLAFRRLRRSPLVQPRSVGGRAPDVIVGTSIGAAVADQPVGERPAALRRGDRGRPTP